jgi:hypothetical protein
VDDRSEANEAHSTRRKEQQHLRAVYHAPNTDVVVAVLREAETKRGTIGAAISVN